MTPIFFNRFSGTEHLTFHMASGFLSSCGKFDRVQWKIAEFHPDFTTPSSKKMGDAHPFSSPLPSAD
jgi:hypothetical protein